MVFALKSFLNDSVAWPAGGEPKQSKKYCVLLRVSDVEVELAEMSCVFCMLLALGLLGARFSPGHKSKKLRFYDRDVPDMLAARAYTRSVHCRHQ